MFLQVLNISSCLEASYVLLSGVWLQHAKPVNMQSRCKLRALPGPPPAWMFWQPESGSYSSNITPPPYSQCCQACRTKALLLRCCWWCDFTCVYHYMQLGARFGIHLTLEQWYRQYGPIYKFFLGRAPVVVVTGTHNLLLLLLQQQSTVGLDCATCVLSISGFMSR